MRMNPFDETFDKNYLYNISTGKSAPTGVADYLLSIKKVGEESRKKFVEKCSIDAEAFSKTTINKVKILNFTATVKKAKVKLNNKLKEVNIQRDIFGTLLRCCMENPGIDIEKVLFRDFFFIF